MLYLLFSFPPYPALMSPMNPSVMYSPPLEAYQQNPNWIPPQLHHRLSVNVTDHYEWRSNPANYYPGYSTTTNSSNIDTMSLNGSLSSGASTNDSSSYPLLAPMPTVYLNQYPQPSSGEQQYFQPTVFFPPQISPRLINEQAQQNILNDSTSNKFVHLFN
jgi:hypothetical protein